MNSPNKTGTAFSIFRASFFCLFVCFVIYLLFCRSCLNENILVFVYLIKHPATRLRQITAVKLLSKTDTPQE